MKTCFLMLVISCFFLLRLFSSLPNEVHGSTGEILHDNNQVAEAKWSGSVTQTTKFFADIEALEKTSETTLDVSFTEAIPTLFRRQEVDDPSTLTDNKGTGTFQSKGDHKLIGPKTVVEIGHFDCLGIGPVELHSVIVNLQAGKYDIEVLGPESKCNAETRYPLTGDVVKSSNDVGSGEIGNSITISQQTLGKNPNILTGSISDSFTIPGIGHGTRAVTWSLYRGTVDAELIITPTCGKSTVTSCSYDTWLPEPGTDELQKGSTMNIALRLQRKGGGAPTVAAESFEIKLFNTSREPGITINYPISPRANQLPDLRMIGDQALESADEDQFLKVGTTDGVTGKAVVASYDGGGYTTLSAWAVLETGIKVKGTLRVPTGESEIRIPSRPADSVIGQSWLKANGNPKETEDKDHSNLNQFDGDGLSAYEEYRGIVSHGAWKRLSPKKKELGVLLKQRWYSDLSPGVARFSSASDIDTIIFEDNGREIPDNRRMNQNGRTAHIFDQFALRINKANTAEKIFGVTQAVFGRVYPAVDIPARVILVAIDVDRIRSNYRQWKAALPALRATESDWIDETVAHEMGHAVAVHHHGDLASVAEFEVVDPPPTSRIFNFNNPPQELLQRPYKLENIGVVGNQSSGNISCVMNYTNRYSWVVRVRGPNKDEDFFQVPPLLDTARIFCNDNLGTGINSGGNYFGNATNGSCIRHIKLKD